VQAGALNSQKLEIGNSKGGTTNVQVGGVTQIQGGALGDQKIRIGNN
jgi:hypothetical protein